MSRQTHSIRRAAHHRRVRLEREAAREAKIEAAKERAELMLTDRDQIFAQYQMNEMKDIYQEQGDIEGLNNLMLKNK